MTYLFFRKEGWYPVDGIKDDTEVLTHVTLDPGTIKVMDALGRRVVWDIERDPMPVVQ